ncbi:MULTISPECIES: radical SAM protein [unclassified Candidatus Frackibacter]|uniref:radical SAM protein n=1 Tax=unclassified Candidatus Frackibacter TaxID=2648818 RepID=UPI00079C1608|nr:MULTISPECIES: radical SAM protein [unclassified Candidatus Frackibacter]KXS40026.1 MAG: radical SAM domain protein [Candidatus Frackibacter sp. T328-2]SDC58252.1 Radical SAM superfamily enzyme with C-terminal helix-hairpin-helix motif [Candidatus Frackibacter sp. WG11]SEM72269.1 Radical SAM superfamily enzyme with C-terminal helix-hairpin-helix motif [Candidatus Frackibacter sp. WG12]SFL81932.1 Radical SAM superfamily enzyme with C-terminal helix-hairpin-helix motif [Candidatus Frackibacter 
MSEVKVSILDGYLDEPSCLGVPPYIAPHIRYTYGALKDAGLKNKDINYLTIDQFRDNEERLISQLHNSEFVIIIAGTTVPGRYLGGQPISLQEIEEIAKRLDQAQVILSGPIINCSLEVKFIDQLAKEVPGLTIYQELTNTNLHNKLESSELIDRWAVLGAEVTNEHPNFPHLVCELETFRGCPRESHCSFCSEGFKEVIYQRSVEGVIKEVKNLAKLGNQYFRLGCQTDLLLYQAKQVGDKLVPNPTAIEKLYSGIREVAPNLKVLHMDNVNPATIADFTDEAAQILETIAKYNTAGDVAAFGLESADPKVLKANNIGTNKKKTMQAIKMMNEASGYREDGVPKLLPGINLLHGLQGESKKTMELNFNFLKKILDSDLLVRRINIRQVNPLKDYEAVHGYSKHDFKEYKEKVNEEINKPMLKRLFPVETILKEVIIEEVKGKLSFGRQLGTYPILVGVPGQREIGEILDVKVIDHGYRSITGLPWPFNINQAGVAELEALPGIGKKRAMRIFMKKDIKDLEHLNEILDYSYDIEKLKELVVFD